jgi:hypothetical protein
MSYRDGAPLGRPSIGEVYAVMTRFERFLFWIAIVDFVVFVAVAMVLGGDAMNGPSLNGDYYLMQHGVYTEVSGPAFLYSKVHTLSLFVTHPIGMVVLLIAVLRARKQA